MLKPSDETDWSVRKSNVALVARNDISVPGGHSRSDKHRPLMSYKSTTPSPYRGSRMWIVNSSPCAVLKTWKVKVTCLVELNDADQLQLVLLQ